jgi:hypothetical protein
MPGELFHSGNPDHWRGAGAALREGMALHLLKLCVGCDSIADLEGWIAETMATKRRLGHAAEQVHTTRMVPRRLDPLLDGGSLYWVIKGQLACRQRLLDVRPFTDGDGIGRCHLVLEPQVVAVQPRPCRPFQGWRYLEARDAPADWGTLGELGAMPEALRRELAELGLL